MSDDYGFGAFSRKEEGSPEDSSSETTSEENDSTENTSRERGTVEETSVEEHKDSFLGVERSNEDDPFDKRTVTYPGVFKSEFVSPPRRDEQKMKVGYYFRNSIAHRLDEFASYLDRHTDLDTSKSDVVEAAVELVLREWELHGEDSGSVQWIRRRK